MKSLLVEFHELRTGFDEKRSMARSLTATMLSQAHALGTILNELYALPSLKGQWGKFCAETLKVDVRTAHNWRRLAKADREKVMACSDGLTSAYRKLGIVTPPESDEAQGEEDDPENGQQLKRKRGSKPPKLAVLDALNKAICGLRSNPELVGDPDIVAKAEEVLRVARQRQFGNIFPTRKPSLPTPAAPHVTPEQVAIMIAEDKAAQAQTQKEHEQKKGVAPAKPRHGSYEWLVQIQNEHEQKKAVAPEDYPPGPRKPVLRKPVDTTATTPKTFAGFPPELRKRKLAEQAEQMAHQT